MKKLDLVLIMALALGVRALYDMNIAQALVALGFIGLIVYSKHLESKKTPNYVELFRTELDDMKSKMSSIYVKQAAKNQVMEGKRFF